MIVWAIRIAFQIHASWSVFFKHDISTYQVRTRMLLSHKNADRVKLKAPLCINVCLCFRGLLGTMNEWGLSRSVPWDQQAQVCLDFLRLFNFSSEKNDRNWELWKGRDSCSRPNISNLVGSKISRKTNIIMFKNANRRVLRLKNCQMFSRVEAAAINVESFWGCFCVCIPLPPPHVHWIRMEWKIQSSKTPLKPESPIIHFLCAAGTTNLCWIE